MVAMDKLSKSTQFIPIESTHKIDDIARILMREILILHGLPKQIISDKDTKLTSKFWKSPFKYLGTQLNSSVSYHP